MVPVREHAAVRGHPRDLPPESSLGVGLVGAGQRVHLVEEEASAVEQELLDVAVAAVFHNDEEVS